jgi:hypothetical protein
MNEPVKCPEPSASADALNDALLFEPSDACDPVIEFYKRDVDRTILRENLKLTPQQRSEKFVAFMQGVHQLQTVSARERRR